MAAIQVGWIGLGSMGIGMSKNLQKHLSITDALPLVYTNRTLSRGEPLESLGAIPVETVGEVAQRSNIIFSCVSVYRNSTRHWQGSAYSERQVSNDQVLQSITDEILASGNINGKIYVDCSTVHPDTSVAIAKQISNAGGEFVAGM